ncbi:MAG: terminase large subunit [Actinomycetes bacterium]
MPPRPHRYSRRGLERANRVRRFGERFVVHKKDRWAGLPFVLEDWQWDNIILPIYGRLNRHGKRKYQQALIGLPRWEGKSEVLALMVMYHLFVDRVQEGEAYVVASNERQANIVFNTVKRMIQAHPFLAAACDIYKREIWVKETGCVFKALPADADSAQGFHPSFCAVDEVHVHKSHALIEAMLSGMVAREEPLLIAITTAGPDRKGVLWEMLHGAEGFTSWPKQPNTYVYWQGAADEDDGHDPAVWRAANPASWITDEMLKRQHEKLPFTSFERYHLNRFPARGIHRAFDAAVWDAMSETPCIVAAGSVMLGADASFSRDTTAVVLDQVDGDGFHNVAAWIFRSEDGSPIDRSAVMATIVDLARTYEVERMVCDRSYFVLEMLQLANEFGIPVEEYPQNNPRMAAAFDSLYSLVTNGRLRHGGDPGLREHILNSALQETPYGPRLTKMTDSQKIDAAVALAMVVTVAEQEYIESGNSFTATGGVWSLGG